MPLAQNSKQSYLLASAKLSEFWAQFHSNIMENLDNIQDLRQWAQFAMPVLHHRLSSISEYQNALNRAENEPFENYNLSIPLLDTDVIRVNLIALEAGRGLPLHDHPDSAGLTLVIAGDLDVTVCEYASPTTRISNPGNVLTVVENGLFSPGQTSCFTKGECNIHGMDALSKRCVLLVIHASPFATDSQSFFFPSSPQNKAGSQLQTQRVRAQTIHNFRQNKGFNAITEILK